MIKATTYEDMVKAVVVVLDTYSGIDPNNIFNSDSIRGTDLSVVSGDEAFSPSAGSAFMLFEFVENLEDDFVTKGETPDAMDTIQSYSLHMMIYGNESPNVAQRLRALFKTPKIALGLREKGVFVNGIEPVESVSEFLNNTWMIRKDLNVTLQRRSEMKDEAIDPGVFEETQQPSVIIVERATRS